MERRGGWTCACNKKSDLSPADPAAQPAPRRAPAGSAARFAGTSAVIDNPDRAGEPTRPGELVSDATSAAASSAEGLVASLAAETVDAIGCQLTVLSAAASFAAASKPRNLSDNENVAFPKRRTQLCMRAGCPESGDSLQPIMVQAARATVQQLL